MEPASLAQRLMTSGEIEEFFKALTLDIPDPVTELYYTNAYTLLVAVALSAQSTDKGVNKATVNLFPAVDTPEKMIALGLDGLREKIKTIGLYPTKAKNIIALSHMLIHDFNGKIPECREDLEKLPGVGRKTANVVLNVVFGHHTIPVDTHIFRVARRTGLAVGHTPFLIEEALYKRIPKEWQPTAHHLLILHGRYTCVARSPKCSTCVVAAFCQFALKEGYL